MYKLDSVRMQEHQTSATNVNYTGSFQSYLRVFLTIVEVDCCNNFLPVKGCAWTRVQSYKQPRSNMLKGEHHSLCSVVDGYSKD